MESPKSDAEIKEEKKIQVHRNLKKVSPDHVNANADAKI
jgi:hypothetical protein